MQQTQEQFVVHALPYLLHKPQGCGECRYCRSNISVHAVEDERKLVLSVVQGLVWNSPTQITLVKHKNLRTLSHAT